MEPFQMPEDKHLLIVTRQACLDCKTIHEITELIQIIYLGLIHGLPVVFIAETDGNMNYCSFY